MRLLYVTDLHGVLWKYERLLHLAQQNQVDVVINGGDLLPRSPNPFATQREFIAGPLAEHFRQFSTAGIQFLFITGNDDIIVLDKEIEALCLQFPTCHSIAQRKIKLGKYEFIGMNWVNDFPFRLKDRTRRDTDGFVFPPQLGKGILSTPDGYRELDDWQAYARTQPTIATELHNLPRPIDFSRTIYVIHAPPANLKLDACSNGTHCGSAAVYDFLRRHQPSFSLHGHIHESPEVSGKWFARLKSNLCFQPGQSVEALTYLVLDLDTEQFERRQENR